MSAPALRVVGEIPAHGPQTLGDALAYIAELEDKLAGYKRTVDKQARDIGGLERRIEAEDDPTQHPKSKEIDDLISRWRTATGHPRAKASVDRVKLIKARLKDSYSIDQLALAIDGLGAYPYRSYGERLQRGTPAQRDDQMSSALGSGESVEKFAVLGHQARKAGLVTWGDE